VCIDVEFVMNRKVFMWFAVMFAGFMVFKDPVGAAKIAGNAIDWIVAAANSISEFFSALAS
jgi:hypothetical protein